jgi:hypothetical protein
VHVAVVVEYADEAFRLVNSGGRGSGAERWEAGGAVVRQSSSRSRPGIFAQDFDALIDVGRPEHAAALDDLLGGHVMLGDG